ncbi:MAG: hypothetical protein P5682_07370, partial [Limnospira sp. PMC 1243.20]|nr:hypothetical protein [Limnospira sp. PMC 1243.20]
MHSRISSASPFQYIDHSFTKHLCQNVLTTTFLVLVGINGNQQIISRPGNHDLIHLRDIFPVVPGQCDD